MALNPALYWRYDELSGTDIADSSGHGRYGHYIVDNMGNEGVELGVSGALSNNDNASFGKGSTYYWYGATFARREASAGLPWGSGARTVEGWAKFSGAVVLARWGGFAIGAAPDGLTVEVDGSSVTIPVGERELNDGRWHHLAVTLSGSTFTGYVDGESIGTVATPAPVDTSTTEALEAGVIPSASSSGWFDELAIYSRALSADDLLANFVASGGQRPRAPKTVTVTAAPSANAIAVTWTKAKAHAPASQEPVETYVATAFTGGKIRGSVSVVGTETSARLSGLPAGDYVVRVIAINGFGVGPARSSANVAVTGASSTAASTILARNPALYWRYGDPSGTVISDSSAHAHRGIYVTNNFANEGVELGVSGGVSNDPDTAFGKSSTYYWYGATFARAISAEGLPSGSSDRTVEAWTKFSGGVTLAQWGGFSVGAAARAVSVEVDGVVADIRVDDLELNDGRWHHLAVTWNGSKFTAFVDGKRVGSVASPAPLDTETSTAFQAAAMGALSNGWFDELVIYPRALKPAQVKADFDATGATVPAAPPSVTASSIAAEPNRITVSWTPSTGVVPASQEAIESYVVSAYVGSTFKGSTAVEGGQTQTVVSGLPAGSAYTIKVHGTNGFGSGPDRESAPVTVTGSTSTYVGGVLGSEPSLYWRYGEPSGERIADASGRGREGRYVLDNFVNEGVVLGVPGALTGDPNTAFGKHGTYYWHGATFARRFTAAGLPARAHERTVEGWVKFSGSVEIASWGGFSVGADATQVTVTVDGASASVPYPERDLNNGLWHHVAVTFDGTRFRVYVDGALFGTVAPPAPLNTETDGPFTAGSITSGSSNGYFDELAVYPRALTAAEIGNRIRTASDAIPLGDGQAALSVVAGIDGPTEVRRGRSNRFTVTLTNTGASPVYGATARLRVPADVTYQLVSPDPGLCERLIAYLVDEGIDFDENTLRDSPNCQPPEPQTPALPAELLYRVEQLDPGQVARFEVDVTIPNAGDAVLTVGVVPPTGAYSATGATNDLSSDPLTRAMISEANAQAGGPPLSEADMDGIGDSIGDLLWNIGTSPFPLPLPQPGHGIELDVASATVLVGAAVLLWGAGTGNALMANAGLAIMAFGAVLAIAFALHGLLTKLVQALTSMDPNDKLGPAGAGAEHWINTSAPLHYVIRFENDPEKATAPAQLVEVVDPLPRELDESTIELDELLVGGRTIPMSGDATRGWDGEIDPGDGAAPILATADIDAESHELRVRIWGDGGGEGQDAYADFLPPNEVQPEGEGQIAFTIGLRDGESNGTDVVNGATITFDSHEGGTAIEAPAVSNRLDTFAPSSAVATLPAYIESRAGTDPVAFRVSWAGADTSGSGVKDYTVWVSRNGGPLERWQSDTSAKYATFTGEPGVEYAFISQARDAAGNLEPLSFTVDASTTVR